MAWIKFNDTLFKEEEIVGLAYTPNFHPQGNAQLNVYLSGGHVLELDGKEELKNLWANLTARAQNDTLTHLTEPAGEESL